MKATDRKYVRDAVSLAVKYWPNAHLGAVTPREDIRSAFRLIRSYVWAGDTILQAAAQIETSAYRHMDM